MHFSISNKKSVVRKLRSGGVSIRKFIDESKKISDARMFNKITRKEISIRVKMTEKMSQYLTLLKIPH